MLRPRELQLLFGPPYARLRDGDRRALLLGLAEQLLAGRHGSRDNPPLGLRWDDHGSDESLGGQVLKRVETRGLDAPLGLERCQAVLERRLLQIRAQDVGLHGLTDAIPLAR